MLTRFHLFPVSAWESYLNEVLLILNPFGRVIFIWSLEGVIGEGVRSIWLNMLN